MGESVTVEEVEAQLALLAGNQEYGAAKYWKADLGGAAWLRWVDAPKMLAQLFSNLTDNRQELRKTRDTVALARDLIEHDKNALSKLSDFIANLVSIAERDTKP